MRFLNISGPGVATDDEFCPHCQVMLEDWDDYKVCGLCHFDTRQQTEQRRIRVRRR
jgi:ribosomal protein S27AE